jgi:hypothetical protein
VALKRQSGIEEYCNYGGFEKMEVNRIGTTIWAIVKHITTSLKDKKDDSM